MRTRTVTLLFVAWMLATGGAAVIADTTHTNMPSDYDTLTRKSIFNKDRVRWQQGAREDRGQEYYRNERQRRTHSPVLVGVLKEDTGYIAFLDELNSGDLVRLKKGDTLPNDAGVVTDVTLDYMAIISPNHVASRITIGQNLRGAVPDPTPDPDDAAATGATSQPAGVSSSAQPGTTTGIPEGPPPEAGSVEDIRLRMMRKRQEELRK